MFLHSEYAHKVVTKKMDTNQINNALSYLLISASTSIINEEEQQAVITLLSAVLAMAKGAVNQEGRQIITHILEMCRH